MVWRAVPRARSSLQPSLPTAGRRAAASGGAPHAPSLSSASVRGLLLVILLIGCGLGWLAGHAPASVQRRAVAAIYQAGGWVVYDTVWDEHLNSARWTPRWPKWLTDRLGIDYFGNVVFVNLHDRGTDDVLVQVGRLTHLKQLHRPGIQVTDAGLAHLGPA